MRRKTVNDNALELGERIRGARERAGFKTIVELRDAIQERGGKITAQFIGQIEHGKMTPSSKTLKMILDMCGVAIADVLVGTNIAVQEDSRSVLAARIKDVRERAGYTTLGQLWKAIRDRGGDITRQYLYQLEHGKSVASLPKLTMILDACGVSMDDFLRTDLVIGPRAVSNSEDRKFVTMLNTIRKLNPALARFAEGAIISAHAEALKVNKQGGLNCIHSGTQQSEKKSKGNTQR